MNSLFEIIIFTEKIILHFPGTAARDPHPGATGRKDTPPSRKESGHHVVNFLKTKAGTASKDYEKTWLIFLYSMPFSNILCTKPPDYTPSLNGE